MYITGSFIGQWIVRPHILNFSVNLTRVSNERQIIIESKYKKTINYPFFKRQLYVCIYIYINVFIQIYMLLNKKNRHKYKGLRGQSHLTLDELICYDMSVFLAKIFDLNASTCCKIKIYCYNYGHSCFKSPDTLPIRSCVQVYTCICHQCLN